MYVIGAHIDGHGWGEGANDNASDTALVMEVARVLSTPDATTDVSIRLRSGTTKKPSSTARGYVAQRQARRDVLSVRR